jgi:lipopolysaccharide assembly protein B
MENTLWQWVSEPENQKLWLGILLSFLFGLIAGRFLIRRNEKRFKSLAREGDKAFFKGIQYILANDHDQAIEEFTKAVQINSDTIETYVALGNLYRSKGDIDRAIRIRQSVILRPNISEEIKLRALLDLGLDYRKGGFLNRALEALGQVLQKEPANLEAMETMERIYGEMKDWENAFSIRQKIARITKGDHAPVLAHYQTETGKLHMEKGEPGKAKSCFEKAISINEHCVDAHLHLGDMYLQKKDYKKAIAAWKKVVDFSPSLTFLAYRRLEGLYSSMKNLKPVEEFLKESAQSHADAFTHMALAQYLYKEHDREGALRELDAALELDLFFWEARKFKGEILLDADMKEEALSSYRDLISHLNVPYLKFQCAHCGFKSAELQWQCPQCKQWDTMGLMSPAAVDASLSTPPSPKNASGPPSENPEEKT